MWRWKSRIVYRGGTGRRIGSDGIDGEETSEEAGGYIGVYATLGVEKRRDGPPSSWEGKLVRIIVEWKGWKADLKALIREISITSETCSSCLITRAITTPSFKRSTAQIFMGYSWRLPRTLLQLSLHREWYVWGRQVLGINRVSVGWGVLSWISRTRFCKGC